MSGEYQLRKDIDSIIDDFNRSVLFKEQSELQFIGEGEEKGTLDSILANYPTYMDIDNLIETVLSGEYDFSNYVSTTELNGILSSYVTQSYANTNYATVTHTHSNYVDRSELSDLDIELTTLQLVPYATNPDGVLCFERVNPTIDELEVSLSVSGDSAGFLVFDINLIEVQNNAS